MVLSALKKATKALDAAQWIWPAEYDTPHNTYSQFRYDFSLKQLPRTAPFFTTADQCYMLYVNGKYVCRGPARGYQENWPYDEIDVAAHLQKGHNWISVRVYNGGISTFQYLHKSAAGFMCAATWGKTKIYSGETWLARFEPGYHRDTARYSWQLNYQEWVDGRHHDQDWIFLHAVPKSNGWGKPAFCRPLGSMPWHRLEERSIPNLTNELLIYERTAYASSGVCMNNWFKENNLFKAVYEELNKNQKWIPAAAGQKTNDSFVITLPKSGANQYRSISVDMGEPCVGSLVIVAQGAKGGEIIDFFFTEGLFADGRPIIGPELTSGCAAAMVNRIELRAKTTRHEFFHMLGHRYVVVIARETSRPIKLKLALRQTVYPIEITGKFDSDNAIWNGIYRICVQTQRVCALDAYVDTSWREQAQWWADARVQGQNTFYLSGDTRLFKRGIISIGRQEVPNGLTFGHAPTIAYNCIMLDFSMHWVLTIWDYYYQTGDIGLFIEHFGRIERLMHYFTGEGTGSNNLLKFDPRYRIFLDQGNIFRDGYSSLLNLWYLYMLRKLGEMAGLSGMDAQKRGFEAMYETQKKLVLRYFWDGKAGLFRDGLDLKDRPVNEYSIHAQTVAIMCGLQKRHHAKIIGKRLLPYLLGKKMDCATPSSYWVTYVYEVMTECGYAHEVVEHIEKNWSSMVASGGTWERFPHARVDGGSKHYDFGHMSMTHAWAAHPIYHFVRTLGGIRQVDAAWKHIRFAPLLEKTDVNKVETAVPTPHGIIRSSWAQSNDGFFKIALSMPKGIEADVIIATVKRCVVKGSNSWNIRIP